MTEKMYKFGDPSGAYFSLYKTKRYLLWRIWNRTKPLIMFIGINPSTAGALDNDRTIMKCIALTTAWGYGGFYMCNLFPGISTDSGCIPAPTPLALAKNDTYLKFIGDRCKEVVFIWGRENKLNGLSKEFFSERVAKVLDIFPQGKFIRVNRDKTPCHPLFLPGNLALSSMSYIKYLEVCPK